MKRAAILIMTAMIFCAACSARADGTAESPVAIVPTVTPTAAATPTAVPTVTPIATPTPDPAPTMPAFVARPYVPLENDELNAQALREAALVGCWEGDFSGRSIPVNFSDHPESVCYIFGEDYNFLRTSAYMDDAPNHSQLMGTWRMDGETVVLTITEKALLVSIPFIQVGDFDGIIYDYDENALRRTPLSEPETLAFPFPAAPEYSVAEVDGDDVYRAYPRWSIMIDGARYWQTEAPLSILDDIGRALQHQNPLDERGHPLAWRPPDVPDDARATFPHANNTEIGGADLQTLREMALFGFWREKGAPGQYAWYEFSRNGYLVSPEELVRFANARDYFGYLSWHGGYILDGNRLTLTVAEIGTEETIYLSHVQFDETFRDGGQFPLSANIGGVDYWKTVWRNPWDEGFHVFSIPIR